MVVDNLIVYLYVLLRHVLRIKEHSLHKWGKGKGKGELIINWIDLLFQPDILWSIFWSLSNIDIVSSATAFAFMCMVLCTGGCYFWSNGCICGFFPWWWWKESGSPSSFASKVSNVLSFWRRWKLYDSFLPSQWQYSHQPHEPGLLFVILQE